MPQPTVIRYVGPCDSVYSKGLAVHVLRGETVDVDDPELAANLLAQEGTWAPVESKAPAKAAGAAHKED